MSSCIDLPSDQLCYIPCNFCNIVLAVSVPCNNLFDTVTVRCGHCSNLWSVNMAAAFRPPSSNASSSLLWQDTRPQHHHQAVSNNNLTHRPEDAVGSASGYYKNKAGTRTALATNPATKRVVNRPPEKRQRVPSAYNQFIKEEIQRIKANHPDISHREAFSTAAKNWAHFPHIHFGLMMETNNQAKLSEGHGKNLQARTTSIYNQV